MKKFSALLFILPLVLLVTPQALAASALNDNIRLFEDTVWIGTFVLMFVFSFLMLSLSANIVNLGFKLLALTGISGFAWKTIGVVKRVFIIDNPEWFFTVTRESLEVFTGVIIGVAFFVLSYGFIQLFNSVHRQPVRQSVRQPVRRPAASQAARQPAQPARKLPQYPLVQPATPQVSVTQKLIGQPNVRKASQSDEAVKAN